MRHQPDEDWHDGDDDRRAGERRNVVYVQTAHHSSLVTWLLGIAATLVTGSIIACAALLWSMNANMTLIAYRLDRVERAMEQVLP